MRVLVLAYQEIGYVGLEALLRAGADVVAVLTHRDDPNEEVWFRSVGDLARERGVPVYYPDDPNAPEVAAMVRNQGPDFIISMYYRHMLNEEFLSSARYGAYNLHGSLLPKYRGRAPVNWVLVNGESETGVTLHRMVRRPDAGAVAAQIAVPIAETDTVRDLYGKMVQAAARLMAETWHRLAAGMIEEIPQDETVATYFGGRRPADGLIRWADPAKKIYNLCRAVTHPYPGAFTQCAGRKLFIWSAAYELNDPDDHPPGTVLENRIDFIAVATGQGVFLIQSAQWEGETERTGAELSGLGLPPGTRLG